MCKTYNNGANSETKQEKQGNPLQDYEAHFTGNLYHLHYVQIKIKLNISNQ